MRFVNTIKADHFGLCLILAVLLMPARASAQTSDPDPTQRPFAKLGGTLSDASNSFAALGQVKKQLDRPAKKLDAERRAYQKARDAYDRDMSILNDRKAAMGTIIKWKCNFANYYHDSPNECDRPDLDGRYVYLNKNGEEVFAPNRADFSAT